VLASDAVGFAAGFCLAIPPIRDQVRRLREALQQRHTAMPRLRARLLTAMRRQRDQFSGMDSLCLLAGALLLIVSFALKLGDK
jgi:hypothetical protein